MREINKAKREHMQDSQDFEDKKLINLSKVPKEEQITLNYSLFHFSSTIKDDKLSLKLVEINIFNKFIFRRVHKSQ